MYAIKKAIYCIGLKSKIFFSKKTEETKLKYSWQQRAKSSIFKDHSGVVLMWITTLRVPMGLLYGTLGGKTKELRGKNSVRTRKQIWQYEKY